MGHLFFTPAYPLGGKYWVLCLSLHSARLPDMETTEPLTVPLTEILLNVTKSVDFGYVSNFAGDTVDEKRTNFWKALVESKASDSGFGHLIDSILRHGFVNSTVGWDGESINEGHHRIAAAILLCIDEVPVTRYGSDWWNKTKRDFEVVAHNWSGDEPIEVEL